MKPTPVDITLNKRDGFLEITWNIDNKVCRYPLGQLREACPCAECRGGHEYMGSQYDPKNLLTLELKPARSHEIKDLVMVGNYAIQPFWQDGHQSGIYTWDYLWKLCPERKEEEDASEGDSGSDYDPSPRR